LEVFENDNQNLCLRVDILETENNELAYKLKDLESQNIQHVQRLQKLLESYQDKENVISNQKHLNFDDLVQMVQEKLKKFEGMIQVDMNTRILEKFDQLRDYYRVIIILL